MPFVYSATNKIGGKKYIGICNSKVRRRWRRHVNSADANKPRNRNCPALHNAIRKYGEHTFEIATLYEAVTWREAQMVERGLIAQYGTMVPNGYNLTCGGEGVLGMKVSEKNRKASAARWKGRRHTPESLVKLSASLKGRKLGPEHVAGMSTRMKAKWADPEFKAKQKKVMRDGRVGSPKVAEAQRNRATGKKHTPETRAKMSAWQIGKKHSDETKRRIGEKHKGRKKTPEQVEEMRQRPFTPEHRAKISAGLKGRVMSPEWRAKNSAGLRRRWERWRAKKAADAAVG